MPFLRNLSIATSDGCWKDGDHESLEGDFHLQAKCLCNKTKFGSIPLGGCDVWREETQILSAFESRHHQVQCSGHLQTLCAGLSERSPGTVLQLVLPVSTLHRRPGSYIGWILNWAQCLGDGVGNCKHIPVKL